MKYHRAQHDQSTLIKLNLTLCKNLAGKLASLNSIPGAATSKAEEVQPGQLILSTEGLTIDTKELMLGHAAEGQHSR